VASMSELLCLGLWPVLVHKGESLHTSSRAFLVQAVTS
jgi:hypothetical protein